MELFGIPMDFYLDSFLKILASSASGAVLGWERKHRYQVVGMRTLLLISVSSTLLAILSYSLTEIQTGKGLYGGDPTRVIAGVVSGIGFLGGGAIVHQGLNIRGLTSAAVVWTASAIGLALGVGLYAQALLVLAVAIFLLIVLEKIESRFFLAGRNKTLRLVFADGERGIDLASIKKAIESHGFKVTDLNIKRIMADRKVILLYSVKSPDLDDYDSVIGELSDLGNLEEFTLKD
ncbi:MAG: MgtC/SapB family protein [Treponema sp.]|nr:MgtC/SapB family protein [Treponema sp.]